jgi:hypothetical protein
MNSEDNLSSLDALKQARLDRLNSKLITVRPNPSKDFIAAQKKIDRFCSSRFANAVAAGRVLKTEEEVLRFADLPSVFMGQADLAGVHDMATLDDFLKGRQ